MGGGFKIWSRLGAGVTLTHPEHGRRAWIPAVLCEQRGKRKTVRKCGQCSRTLVIGERVFRPHLHTSLPVRSVRICEACVVRMPPFED